MEEADVLDGVGHGTLLAGRYRLEERVRSGAEGSTWRAFDENRDRQVMVRLLRPGHPHAAEVVDAARRAALVDDQRLARVLGVADGSLVYVVSEHVPGRDLASLVSHVPLPGETVRRIIGEAAQALDRADARGLHHLRLDPRSISVDRDGAVKVLGTGVDAAAAGIEPDDSASHTDALDLVKLLYAGLTGRWPGAAAAGLEEAPRVAGRAVPPGDLMTGVPGDLDTLCATSLGGPDDGPRSPGELAAALSPWAEAAPLERPGGLAPAGPSRPIPIIGLADPETEFEAEPEGLSGSTLLPPRPQADAEPAEPEPIAVDQTVPAQTGLEQAVSDQAVPGQTGSPRDGSTPWWTGPQPGVPLRESTWTADLDKAFSDGGPVVEHVDLTAMQTSVYPVARDRSGRQAAAAQQALDAAERADERTLGDDRDEPALIERAPQVRQAPAAEPDPLSRFERPDARLPSPPLPSAGPAPGPAPSVHQAGQSPAALAAAAALVRTPGDVPVYGTDREPSLPPAYPVDPEGYPQEAHPAGAGEPVQQDAGPYADQSAAERAATGEFEMPWAGLGRPVPDEAPIGPFGLQLPTTRPPTDQTRVVLVVVGVIVVIGLILAVNTLRGISGFSLSDPQSTVPIPSVSAPPVGSTKPGGTQPQAAPPAGRPVGIAKVQPLDPQGDKEENDGRASRAADNDPATAWASKTYKSAQFGGLKQGIGLGLQLPGDTAVRQVVVHLGGSASGGQLELRTAGGLSLDGSTVIASTAVDGGTATFNVSTPVRTRYLVLWCTQLPKTGNGFRLQVSEVEVR